MPETQNNTVVALSEVQQQISKKIVALQRSDRKRRLAEPIDDNQQSMVLIPESMGEILPSISEHMTADEMDPVAYIRLFDPVFSFYVLAYNPEDEIAWILGVSYSQEQG